MLKYTDTKVTFQEVPDEITLCINISGCRINCPECHSPYLSQDIGTSLDESTLMPLIGKNDGISCVAFMGGDSEPEEINKLAAAVRDMGLKTCWYSGKQGLAEEVDINNLSYLKLGPYMKDKGPLNSKTTNQRFFAVINGGLTDITYRFYTKEDI